MCPGPLLSLTEGSPQWAGSPEPLTAGSDCQSNAGSAGGGSPSRYPQGMLMKLLFGVRAAVLWGVGEELGHPGIREQ